MTDNFKDGFIALFALTFASSLASHSSERMIVSEWRRSVSGGEVRAAVVPSGPFGALFGQFQQANIRASGFTMNQFGFSTNSARGIHAHLNSLNFVLSDFQLNQNRISTLAITIPTVNLDFVQAIVRGKSVIQSAGTGTAVSTVTEHDLAAFLMRKYPQLKGVSVKMGGSKVNILGRTPFLGRDVDFSASGSIEITGGTKVNVINPTLNINGAAASNSYALAMLKTINPVLDVEVDLGLGKLMLLQKVEPKDGKLRLTGTIRLPVREKSE